MNNLKTIGYIIPTLPRYSETFFLQDFRTLRNIGYNIVVFPLNNRDLCHEALEFPIVNPPVPLSKNPFLRAFQLTKVFLKLTFRSSWRSLFAFYKLEKKDEIKITKILAKIYTNASFFLYPKPEVLIFGYGNLIIERENLAKALGAKMIVGFQGSDLKVFPLNHNQNLFQKGLQRLDAAFFRNQHLRQLAEQYGMPSNKPHSIIFNKIDTSFFQPKKNLGQLNEPLKILAVGRLHWIKGFPHLLKALAMLENRGINWELRIIGEGEEEEHLFYTAMELGILNKVQFLGGKSQKEVKAKMIDSDIFINSSFFESNCRALIEAQAMGLMLISTHWPEADKVVLHEKTGWLVPKRNPSAIAEQVEKIASMPEKERESIAHNAIQHVQKHFNLKDAPKDFEQLLEQ